MHMTHRQKVWGLAIAMALVIGPVFAWLFQYIAESNQKKWAAERQAREDAWWSKEIDRVEHRQSDQIVVAYGCRDCDKRLHDLERLVGLHGLAFANTDISARGMASIAAIPNLRELSIFGCEADHDFEVFRGKASLRRLDLVFMDAHHKPLPVLASLPNLRELVLFDREHRNGAVVAEDTWYWLGELRQLRRLKIGGAGLTDECLDHLRELLPNVEVKRLWEEPSMK